MTKLCIRCTNFLEGEIKEEEKMSTTRAAWLAAGRTATRCQG